MTGPIALWMAEPRASRSSFELTAEVISHPREGAAGTAEKEQIWGTVCVGRE